jgi:outer membrane protein assembly factor BamB
MSNRWKNILLTICSASLLFAACKKQFSSDTPLPTSYSPSIIIGSDNQVFYALNPATGAKNWQYALPPLGILLPKDFSPSPLLYNGMVYFTAINSDTIYKVNGSTGALVKKMTVPGTSLSNYFTVIATPVADKNIIFLATTNDTLYAIDTGTAAIQWKFGTEGSLESSPVVYNGYVYIGTIGGHVAAINETTGPATGNIPTWEYPDLDVATTAQFVSSPAICPPYLYIGSVSDSDMYCIYLNPLFPPATALATSSSGVPIGAARWIYKTGGAIHSSPNAFDGLVAFGSDDHYVHCVDTAPYPITGAIREVWKVQTGDVVYSSPCFSQAGLNQNVYIGSFDYNLYAINLINGGLSWKFPTRGLVKSSPLVYNGMVYIGSYDDNLYAVDSATGTLKWQFNVNGNIECSPVVNDLTGNNYNASQISGFMRQPTR